jgi:hypothetical protein
VELAVCLPVIVPLVFASIEAANMVFLQEALQTTAYETARLAVKIGSSKDEALSWGGQMLTLHNVQGGSITIQPLDELGGLGGVLPGTMLTITATAPISSNRLLSGWFFSSGNLSATCVMQRE